MIGAVRDHLRAALEIVYPRRCGGCGSVGEVVCAACRDAFEPVHEAEACPVCGAWVGSPQVCGGCMGKRQVFDRGWFGYYFQGPLREALLAFKFRGRKDVGRELVRMRQEAVESFSGEYDVIVPLPVTEKRLRERGFNQSYILAEEVGALAGKPVTPVLRKVRPTEDQFTLSREARRRNVRKAFAVTASDVLKEQKVLLVDDLFTTGATAREAARTLKQAGAERVVVFALARTP